MRRRTIGERLFVDGITRPVYEDDRGQYVLDDDRQRVDGVWFLADEPILISEVDRGR
jgi:hypothetical protein